MKTTYKDFEIWIAPHPTKLGFWDVLYKDKITGKSFCDSGEWSYDEALAEIPVVKKRIDLWINGHALDFGTSYA